MKTFAYINTKGGVGKTTLCAETAVFSQSVLNLRTIVIDTDINGSMLDFACDRMEKCALPFPNTIGHCQSNIDKKIKMLRESGEYDVCLVDCHGDWDRLETNLMYEVDLIILPVIPDVKNIRPTIKVFEDRMNDIIKEREGQPEHMVLVNNISKKHSSEERRLISLIEKSSVNLCPKQVFTHKKCFRDTWKDGLTIMDVYINKLDDSYISAGINIREYMEHLFGQLEVE